MNYKLNIITFSYSAHQYYGITRTLPSPKMFLTGFGYCLTFKRGRHSKNRMPSKQFEFKEKNHTPVG